MPAIVGLISLERIRSQEHQVCLCDVFCVVCPFFKVENNVRSSATQHSDSKAVRSTMTMSNLEMVSDPSPIFLPFDDLTLSLSILH